MSSSEWISRWLKVHMKLNPHAQWELYMGDSAARRAMQESWIVNLDARGIDERTAYRASRRLVARPPGHPDKHLPAILAMVAEIRAEDAAKAERRQAERRRAEEKARDLERARQQQLWDQSTEKARREATAAVEAEGNAIIRWPSFKHALCLEELASRESRAPRPRAQAQAQA